MGLYLNFLTRIKVDGQGTDEYWIDVDPQHSGKIDKVDGLKFYNENMYKPCYYQTPFKKSSFEPVPSYCIENDLPDFSTYYDNCVDYY